MQHSTLGDDKFHDTISTKGVKFCCPLPISMSMSSLRVTFGIGYMLTLDPTLPSDGTRHQELPLVIILQTLIKAIRIVPYIPWIQCYNLFRHHLLPLATSKANADSCRKTMSNPRVCGLDAIHIH